MHLTIFAYYSSINGTIENAVPRVDGWSVPAYRVIKRCAVPGDILPTVKNAVVDAGVSWLEKLDCYGHGRPGSLILSADRMIDWTPQSDFWVKLAELRQWLSPTAHVRLLGCDTGTSQEGFDLIKELARELGEQRVVSAPRSTINYEDFTSYGFKEEVARECLVSSDTLTGPVEGLLRPSPVSEKVRKQFDPWIERLQQPGYLLQSYGRMPAAIVDGSEDIEGFTVTVSSARRVIAITLPSPEPDSHPLSRPDTHFILRWLKREPAPSLEDLLDQLRVKLMAT